MKLQQIYTKCLAHAAYYLESDGEVALFDPLRDPRPYMEMAKNNQANIKYIFETHFHADFVSGHLDIAQATGAKIVYGPTAKPSFDAIIAKDEEVFKLGKCLIKAIHTPGHTLESTVYLITDERGKETSLITGDTLFIGDVGRPDLAQQLIADLTEERLAGMLFHSLRDKIMPLDNHIVIYPNHGAGSACGKNMSDKKTDTLGNQKFSNYALNPELTEVEFKKLVLSGLTPPPQYFPSNVLLNINGYTNHEEVLAKSLNSLDLEKFVETYQSSNHIILDTRNAEDFAKGHIPNSLNIGLDGNFAQWVGELIRDIEQPMLLVCDKGTQEEAITRLARIGYDGVIGYLEKGFDSWIEKSRLIGHVSRMDADEFSILIENKSTTIVDVRKASEFQSQHILWSQNIPLNSIEKSISSIPRDRPFVLICVGGYRSMIAASILKKNGIHNFVDIRGGFDAIKETPISLSNYQTPTTQL